MTEIEPVHADQSALHAESGPRWRRLLVLILLFIFCTRVWLVERYGASLPQIDEWQATGAEILSPWHRGKLTIPALFEAHNGDHRIVATRLLEIACFELNGSWDPKLILTVKAGIYSFAAAILIQLLVGRLPKRRAKAGVLLALLFAFPFNWQNLLWAFQSQFDFFILALGVGWLALINNRPGIALASSFLALFTLGAGPVLAFSYVPFALWRGYCRETSLRSALFFSALAGTIGLFGLSLRSTNAAPLGSPYDQFVSLNSALAWPYSNMLAQLPSEKCMQLVPAILRNFPSQDSSWLQALSEVVRRHTTLLVFLNAVFAAVILSPTLRLGYEVFRRKSLPREISGTLGLAGFALLMMLATAVARGGQLAIAVRYLDLVCLIGFSSIVAAFALSCTRPRPWLRWWALFMAAGYLAIMTGTISRLNQRIPAHWLANLQKYFPSHDHSLLTDNQANRWPILENASVSEFMESLDDPEMESILPHAVTHPDYPLGPAAKLAAFVRRAGSACLILFVAAAVRFLAIRSHPPILRRAPGFQWLMNVLISGRFNRRSA